MKYSAFDSRKSQEVDPDHEAHLAAYFAKGGTITTIDNGQISKTDYSRREMNNEAWKKSRVELELGNKRRA